MWFYKKVFCTECHEAGYSMTHVKGSMLTELFLWCLFIIPGLIYGTWRLMTKYTGCEYCASPKIIPLESKRALTYLGEKNEAVKTNT